jgi:hypothetical protein
MDKLAKELDIFYQTTLDCKEYILGKFDKRPSFNINNMDIQLSDELKYLYTNYNLDFRFIIRNIYLPNFDKLNKKQYGYKYISNDLGKTFELNNKWDNNWLVFADMNDDPIVADISIIGTPIYAAIEARNYMKISPSLDIFVKILTELLKSLKEKNVEDLDDDYEEDVIMPYFLEKVERILDKEYFKNFKNFII